MQYDQRVTRSVTRSKTGFSKKETPGTQRGSSKKTSSSNDSETKYVPLKIRGYRQRKPVIEATTSKLSAENLEAGYISWLSRQPGYMQDSLNFLGVYSYQPKDQARFLQELKTQWNVPFGIKHAMTHPISKTTRPKQLNENEWQCSSCQVANPKQKTECTLCEKPNSLAPQRAPSKFTLTLEQEAERVMNMRRQVLPLHEVFVDEKKSTFTAQSDSEMQVQPTLLAKVEKGPLAPCFEAKNQDDPPYLVAFFKESEATPCQALVLDKRNSIIEWFDPMANPHHRKFIQESTQAAKPKVRWNLLTNKRQFQSETLDFPALWYMTMRFGYERSGGPQSFETLASMPVSNANATMLFNEFFQEK